MEPKYLSPEERRTAIWAMDEEIRTRKRRAGITVENLPLEPIQHPSHWDEIQFILKQRTLAKPLGAYRWAWRRAWGVWRVCWHVRSLTKRRRLRLFAEAPGILWRSYKLARRAYP